MAIGKEWRLGCRLFVVIERLQYAMFTIKRTAEFDAWLFDLRDTMTRIRRAKRLDKVQRGLLGDTKPVGDGVLSCAKTSAQAGACTTSSVVMCWW